MNLQTLLSSGIKQTPASFVRGILKAASEPNIFSFAGGLPNPISFPQEALQQSMQRIVEQQGSRVFQYSTTAGLPELRHCIAERYNRRFGLRYTEDNVLITTGSQQALDLIAKVLLDKGDGVVVEHPTYLAAIQAFSLHQPVFHPVELTEQGMNPAGLEAALAKNPKFIYMIPDFQNPTGLTYSRQNRERIYEILKDRNIVLVEDDPYGELRFEGGAASLHRRGQAAGQRGAGNLLQNGHAGYANRIHPLRECGAAAPPLHRQGGERPPHQHLLPVSYLGLSYAQRSGRPHRKDQGALPRAGKRHDGRHAPPFSRGRALHEAPGRHVPLGYAARGKSALQLFPKALERGVAFVPGDPFYIGVTNAPTMRLNYTNASADKIEEGIRRLGELIAEMV